MSDLPLVTCIMPTRNRTRFIARAIGCFLKQDYPRKQLFILEEESQSVELDGLLPRDVSYERLPEQIYMSIGAKRNTMCASVQGDLIAHWDDDDWHSPHRLSTQVKAMREQGARLCGLDRLVFYNGERAHLFKTVRYPWLAGGTLMYERSLWKEQPFTEVSNGEDTAFVDAAHKRGCKIATIEDPSLYVAMLHADNTTKRNIDAQWGGFDADVVRKWMSGEPACSV